MRPFTSWGEVKNPNLRTIVTPTYALICAERAKDLVKLSQLLATLKRQEDCTTDDVDNLKREMSKIAAALASGLVQRGKLDEAENWL